MTVLNTDGNGFRKQAVTGIDFWLILLPRAHHLSDTVARIAGELWPGPTTEVRDSRTSPSNLANLIGWEYERNTLHILKKSGPVKSSKSDWLRIRKEYSEHAQKIGSSQSSRYLPQARRIVGSENELTTWRQFLCVCPIIDHEFWRNIVKVVHWIRRLLWQC